MELDEDIIRKRRLLRRRRRSSFKDADDSSNLFTNKITELEQMKENLKQAKDDAMQSWLDSRPLIDELEKMQAELASAKERVTKANTTISEIQAQLGTTNMCIKSSKDEEFKYRTMINDINQDLHKTHEEMEQHKMKIDKKRRRKSKLKQVLRVKKQTLQTLQLTYEAAQLESEAFATSAAQAFSHINNFEASNIMVRITQEEYDLLRREAQEQTYLAERRVSASVEEKLAAENSRDSALRRLRNSYPHSGSSQRYMIGKTDGNVNAVGSQSNHRKSVFSKVQAKSTTGVNRRNPEQQIRNKFGYSIDKNKSSIFVRIKTFFVRKLSKYFK